MQSLVLTRLRALWRNSAKCNSKDRWSNTNGNNGGNGHRGDDHWRNDETLFGTAESACKDDYKGRAYNGMTGKNVMMWHVPNGQNADQWSNQARYKYYTYENFLADYDGLLPKLYENFPLITRTKHCSDNRNSPYPRVKFAKGSTGQFDSK